MDKDHEASPKESEMEIENPTSEVENSTEVEQEENQEPKTYSINELNNEQLQKSLEEAKDYKNKYLGALAELENTRKRLQKEKQEMMQFAVENVLCEFLTPLDSIENAMGFTDQMSDETKNWVHGFKMLVGQLKDVIAQHGVSMFHAKGEKFDPHLHEAVEVEETNEYEEDIVLEEFIKGYKIGDRILRPAKVKVSKKLNKEKQNQAQ